MESSVALASAPPPPPPGASPSTSSTSRSPQPTPGASTTHPPPSPVPEGPSSSTPGATVGRSKDQRWRDASPSPSPGPSAKSRSFMDVLVRGDGLSALAVPPARSADKALSLGRAGPTADATSSACPRAAASSSDTAPARAPVRIILRPRDQRVHLAGAAPPDRDGWVTSESRRRRRDRCRRQEFLKRRHVPSYLQGRCFNCLSTSHRAASCRSSPRCFACRGLGHRFAVCPSRCPRPPLGRRLLAWRSIASASSLPHATLPPLDSGAGVDAQPSAEGDGDRARKRRRRRRPRRAHPTSDAPPGGEDSTQDDEEEEVPDRPLPEPNVGDVLTGAVAAPSVPRRILD